MSERSHHDRPASAIAITLGLVLIIASVPLVWALMPQERIYDVSWREAAGPTASVPLPATQGTQGTAAVEVKGLLTSTVVVTIPSCDDNGTPNLHPPAEVTWALEARTGTSTQQLATDTVDCSQAAGYSKVVARALQPELGERVGAGDEEAALQEARASVWSTAKGLNETATYTLRVSWTRAPGAAPAPPAPLPLPVPTEAPAPTGTLAIQQYHWVALLNERVPQEVVR